MKILSFILLGLLCFTLIGCEGCINSKSSKQIHNPVTQSSSADIESYYIDGVIFKLTYFNWSPNLEKMHGIVNNRFVRVYKNNTFTPIDKNSNIYFKNLYEQSTGEKHALLCKKTNTY